MLWNSVRNRIRYIRNQLKIGKKIISVTSLIIAVENKITRLCKYYHNVTSAPSVIVKFCIVSSAISRCGVLLTYQIIIGLQLNKILFGL